MCGCSKNNRLNNSATKTPALNSNKLKNFAKPQSLGLKTEPINQEKRLKDQLRREAVLRKFGKI